MSSVCSKYIFIIISLNLCSFQRLIMSVYDFTSFLRVFLLSLSLLFLYSCSFIHIAFKKDVACSHKKKYMASYREQNWKLSFVCLFHVFIYIYCTYGCVWMCVESMYACRRLERWQTMKMKMSVYIRI